LTPGVGGSYSLFLGVTGGTSSTGLVVSTGGTIAAAGASARCDGSGKCTCIRIAEFGNTGTFGAVQGAPGSTALQQWLNTKSTASVDVFAQRTMLTPELLANYDILILQDLTNVIAYGAPSDLWTFSATEVAAVSDWVQTKGGAIVTMTGYFSDAAFEITPTNQLIAFSGISYNADDIINTSDCSDGLCFCYNNAIPITSWVTTHPIGNHIKAVGAFRGRSLNAPSSAAVVAKFGNSNVGVAVEVGQGRVFAFGDEWVSYTSQWNDSSLSQPAVNYDDPYNPCYGKKPSQAFQISQFWFNVIDWLQPSKASCFQLNEAAVVP